MCRRGALTENEKAKIVKKQKKQCTREIANMLGHDHRTIKKYATNPQSFNGRADKGKICKKLGVSCRVVSLIKRQIHRHSLNVPKTAKSIRCSVLQRIEKCKKPLYSSTSFKTSYNLGHKW